MEAIIRNLRWQSDWNGYEVGYPLVPVVGLYTNDDLGVDLYVNTETGDVIELRQNDEDITDMERRIDDIELEEGAR